MMTDVVPHEPKRQQPEERRPDYVQEIGDRQRNLLWPDAMKNSRSADWFLWHGSPDPPIVQRIGAWLFGLTFLGMGVMGVVGGWQKPELALSVLGGGFLYVGARIFRNGFPRRAKSRNSSGR